MPGDEANNTWDSDKALNPFKPLLSEKILIADKSESQVEDCLELNFRNVDYCTYPTVLTSAVDLVSSFEINSHKINSNRINST